MNEFLKLPVEFNPYFQCYHNMAFPLSIIQGNAKALGKDIIPWVSGKYLNCTFDHTPSDNKFEIYVEDSWGVGEGILDNQYISVKTKLFNILGIDLIKSLRTVLADGWYVHGMYNEKYIPGKEAYLKYDYCHDYILYGFNDDKQIFYSIGYLANKKYVPFEIPYDNYLAAFYKNSMSMSVVSLCKYNASFEFTGNVTNIITGLKDYIGSSNTYGLRPNFSYGLTAIKKLKEYILSSTLNLGMRRIDDRYTRALAEHQYVIMQCVKFLTEKKKLDINSEDVGLVDTLYQKAKMLHMLGIKFNISQDKEILQSILSGFQYILDHSNKPLCKVIDSLRYI